MGTTKSLNSSDSAWCHTFFCGTERNRCYEFAIVKDGVRATAIFSEAELFEMLGGWPNSKVALDEGLPRPEMDRY